MNNKRLRKLLLSMVVVFTAITLSGCKAQNQKNANHQETSKSAKYLEELNTFVTNKGYDFGEIQQLKDFQIVDKEYDNEVLERFNKIQGYIYHYTSHDKYFVEGWVTNGPFYFTSIEKNDDYINGMRKYSPDSTDSYDEYGFSGYIILPCYYVPSDDIKGNYGIQENDLTRKYIKKYGSCGEDYSRMSFKLNNDFDYAGHYQEQGFIKEMKDFSFNYELVPSNLNGAFEKYYYLTDDTIEQYIKDGAIKENQRSENDYKYSELQYDKDLFYSFITEEEQDEK